MLLAQYPPPRTKHLPVDPLRLRMLRLVPERRCKIVRTPQRLRMLLAEYPPLCTKHLPLDPLRVRVLPLARERRCQIACTPQRLRMLLAEYPPPRTKNLPVDPLRLRVRVLPLAREGRCQIARTYQRVRMLRLRCSSPSTRLLALRTSRLIRSACACFPCSESDDARLFALLSVSGCSSPSTRLLALGTSRWIRSIRSDSDASSLPERRIACRFFLFRWRRAHTCHPLKARTATSTHRWRGSQARMPCAPCPSHGHMCESGEPLGAAATRRLGRGVRTLCVPPM
jgi:hypothetical protein